MENPKGEIKSVVQQLTATGSPDIQKAAFEKYMAPDVSFRHPVCAVASGPNSRKEVLGIYQWYRILSPYVDIEIKSIGRMRPYLKGFLDLVFDPVQNLLYLECVQWFKLFFLPISAAPARLITRLVLRRQDGLYYIAQQEDFYHPEDFATLILPHSAPFFRLGLATSTRISNVLYCCANLLGLWKPQLSSANDQDATLNEAGLNSTHRGYLAYLFGKIAMP